MEGTTRAGKYMCVKSNQLTLGDLGVGLHLIAHFVFIFYLFLPLLFFIFFSVLVLGITSRASCMLGKCYI